MLNPLCLIPVALDLYYHSLQLNATVYYIGREVDICPLGQIGHPQSYVVYRCLLQI